MLTNSNFKEQMLRKVKEQVLSKEAYDLLFDLRCDSVIDSSSSTDLISIIIPTHNRYNMLCRCVDSVLMQTHKQLEIIVIDDNSSDETPISFMIRYSNEPRIHFYRNDTSLGPGGARQKGYLQAHGDFIVFIDDDDYYIEPRFFANALEIFAQYQSCSLVCGNTISEWYNADNTRTFAYRPLNFTGWKSGEEYFIGFIRCYRKPSSSFPVVFKKAALDIASFADMKMMNDASIYLRALCFGDVYALKMIVGVYYIHASNISKALPFEFIIQNLEEKKNIFRIAKDRNIKDINKWFRQQVFSTVVYFFSQPTVTPEGKNIINQWCENNGLHFKFSVRFKLLMSNIMILARRLRLKIKIL